MIRKQTFLNDIRHLWFEIAFIVWVIADVSAFFIYELELGNHFVVSLVKGVIVFLFGLYVFSSVRKSRVLITYSFLVISWFIGNIYSFSIISDSTVVFKNFIFFVKFNLLFVIVFAGVKYYSKRCSIDKFYNLVDFLFLLHAIIAILGFVFQVDFLKSYSGNRFGYTSFVVWANDAASLLLIGVLYFYVTWYRNSSRIIAIKLFTLLFAFVLIGSKSTLIVGSVISFSILNKLIKDHRVGVKIMFYGGILLLILSFLYLVDYFSFYEQTYQELGLLNMLSSIRYEKLVEVSTFILSEYSVASYLFGTIDFYRYHCESDVVDVFLLLGFVGGAIYIYIGFMGMKLLNNKMAVFVLGNILLLSTFAGHFLYNTIIPFYFCALYLRLTENITFHLGKEAV
ncbi:MAG: hypothetical protein JXC36_07085 [Candidatus Atribacteria bacterium]|nr:hypothetical protein [Candidatus Atribacteria bacterium]